MTVIGGAGSRPASAHGGTMDWVVLSDVGHVRAANEDSALALPGAFAVADGMGGHAAGDLASAAAVERLADLDGREAVDEGALLEALTAASADIDGISEAIEADAGTTVTGVVPVFEGSDLAEWLVFNVGDSRVYLFRQGRLAQLTVDHSLVQLLVDEGVITAAEAEHHPDGNVVTRALGFGEAPRPDFSRLAALGGDLLLLCSDGLTKELDADRIRELLASSGDDLAVLAAALVDEALESGGRDNVTVVLLRLVDEGDGSEHP